MRPDVAFPEGARSGERDQATVRRRLNLPTTIAPGSLQVSAVLDAGAGTGAPFVWARSAAARWRCCASPAICAGGAPSERPGGQARLRLLPWLPRLRRAEANSALVLATNPQTAEIKAGAAHAELFCDNGVVSEQLAPHPTTRRAGDRLELVWAGRLGCRKRFLCRWRPMALVSGLPIRLGIARQGPLPRGAGALSWPGAVRVPPARHLYDF